MILKVLHNGNCSKSRAALDFLKENGVAFEVINLIEDPLSVLEIKTLLKKLNQNVHDLIRKTDRLFLENYEGKQLSDEEWITVLAENPSLIQRPIVIKGSEAIVARPIENIKSLLV